MEFVQYKCLLLLLLLLLLSLLLLLLLLSLYVLRKLTVFLELRSLKTVCFLEIDNVCGQISQHVFVPNGGYYLCILAGILVSTKKLEIRRESQHD